MRTEPERTAMVKVEFPDRGLATTLLQQWTERSDISLSILRGRVTAEEACYELRLEGGAAGVARIIGQTAPWRASRRLRNAAPAGMPA